MIQIRQAKDDLAAKRLLILLAIRAASTPLACLERYVPRLPPGQPRIVGECTGDSPSASHPATILTVTRERWAQIGITVQFLIAVRTLAEIFRLRHFLARVFPWQSLCRMLQAL